MNDSASPPAPKPTDRPDEQQRCLFYEAARSELVARIGYRDGALLAYVTAMGAYFGFVIGREGSLLFQAGQASPAIWQELLLIAPLPFISATFTLVIIQHHILIGIIQKYLVHELYPDVQPPSYDASRTLLGAAKTAQLLRTFAQMGALAFPMFYAFCFHAWYFLASGQRTLLLDVATKVFLLFEVVAVGVIVWLHLYAHRQRRESYTARLRSRGLLPSEATVPLPGDGAAVPDQP